MKKILLVSGCSFTTNKYESAHHPDLVADWPKWPELLAKKLNMNCINVGQSGAGQEYIYNSLVRNINAKNIYISENLSFANNAKINTDVPFLIDTGSDQHIKFIDGRGTPAVALSMGYDKDDDVYEIDGGEEISIISSKIEQILTV